MDGNYWNPIQKTCHDLQPAGNNRKSVPTEWFLKITANPPPFVKAKIRRILRMVHLICLDALSEGKNFRSDKVFARKTPILQIERNALETRRHWAPNTSHQSASRKRYHSESDSFDDSSSSDDEENDNCSTSTALVKPNISLTAAMVMVKPFLPKELATDEHFVSFAATQALYQGLDGRTFASFVLASHEERKRDLAREYKREREERERARDREELERERVRIREPDVRAEVEIVFDEAFDVPCGYSCGAQMSAVHYYVVREGDDLTLCRRHCFIEKGKQGFGKTKRIMKPSRAHCWINSNGRQVRGQCHHCGPSSRTTIHLLLDEWHAGHDEAKSKGGSLDASNLAPLHPRCNFDQGVSSFAEYRRK